MKITESNRNVLIGIGAIICLGLYVYFIFFKEESQDKPTSNVNLPKVEQRSRLDGLKENSHMVRNVHTLDMGSLEDVSMVGDALSEQKDIKEGIRDQATTPESAPEHAPIRLQKVRTVIVYKNSDKPKNVKAQKPTDPPKTRRRSGFNEYNSSTSNGVSTKINEPILCVVNSTMDVKNGDIITLRVTEAFEYKNIDIPRNTLLPAVVTFRGNRLDLFIGGISIKNQQIDDVELIAYDPQGGKGLRLNGDVNRDIKNSATNSTIRSVASSIPSPLASSVARLITTKNNDVVIRVYQGQEMILKNI